MIRFGSQAEGVFKDICSAVDCSIRALSNPRKYSPVSMQYGQFLEMQKYRDNPRKYKLISQLKRAKYIKIIKRRGKDYLALTEKGLSHALIRCMQESPHQLPEGLQCLVLFDVPEEMRWIRHALRSLLQSLNFRMLQKSAWISRRDAMFHLQYFAKINHIENWVQIFAVTKLPTPTKSTIVKKRKNV